MKKKIVIVEDSDVEITIRQRPPRQARPWQFGDVILVLIVGMVLGRSFQLILDALLAIRR
jgi:hypothetical protein